MDEVIVEPGEGLPSQLFRERYARSPEETWVEACDRVAEHVSNAEDNGKRSVYRDIFAKELKANTFMPGGRIWYGSGRSVAQLLNCFVIGDPATMDSREGWGKLLYDTCVISGTGGGIGANFSPVRGRGFSIKGTGGVSTGSVSLMKMQDSISNELRQGGGRRAALMQCLNVNHPDILEFLEVKLDKGELNNANISIVMNIDPFEFKDKVEMDEDIELEFNGLATGEKVNARWLWNKLVENAWASGDPGILNGWLANKMNNISYYEELISVNPCFSGSELLLTKDGYSSMYDLYLDGEVLSIATDDRISYVNENPGEHSENWKFDYEKGGVTFRESSAVQLTQKKVDLVWVETDHGFSVRCTPNHRIATQRGMVEAKNLIPDEDQVLVVLPEIEGSIIDQSPESDEEIAGLLCGLIAGDGTFGNNQAKIEVWGEDSERLSNKVCSLISILYEEYYDKGSSDKGSWVSRKLVPFTVVEIKDKITIQSTWLANYLERVYGFNAETKLIVPSFVMKKARHNVAKFYLAGLYYADGSVQGSSQSGYSIRLSQSHEGLLRQTQLLLQANGILSKVYKRREAHLKLLPDGRGGQKKYSCKAQFELIFYRGRDVFGQHIGFLGHPEKTKRLSETPIDRQREKALSRVSSVTEIEEKEDVFCLRQDETKTLCVQGISAVRCGEQWLGPYDCCCLGNLVLPRFVIDGEFDFDQFDESVRVGVRFLDNVLTVNDFPLDEIKKKCHYNRRIGLGVMGLHSAMLELGLVYGSDKGLEFVDKLFNIMKNTAYDESVTLAAEKGPFPGYRPEFLKSQFVKTLKPALRNKIKHHGIRNCALLTVPPTGTTSMVSGNGMSSGIEPIFAPAYNRRVRASDKKGKDYYYQELVITDEYKKFGKLAVGAYDLSLEAHLKTQVTAQKHVDSAISKTLNIPEDFLVEDLKTILLEYLPFVKGLTLYRQGSRGLEPLEHILLDDVDVVLDKEHDSGTLEEMNTMDCVSGVCNI